MSDYPIDQLFEQADALLNDVVPNVEGARVLFEQALKQEPENVDVLDRFGDFLCTFGDPSEALKLFQKSIHIRPDAGVAKYLYMGQMSQGHDALNYFEKALTVGNNSDTEKIAIYIAVVELYMTDLCDEPDAQEKCEKALEMGHALDPDDLEINIALATYNKTIQEMEKAIEFAKKADERLKKIEEENDRIMGNIVTGGDFGDVGQEVQQNVVKDDLAGESGDKKDESMDVDMAKPDEEIQEIATEVQVKLVSTMIDLRMFDEADRILDRLMEADEDDIQIWYLSGLLNVCREDKETALEDYKGALKLCKKYPENKEFWSDNLKVLKERIDKLA